MSFHSGAVPWRRREQKEGRPFVRTRRSRARSLGATIRRLKPAEDRPIAAWGASGDIAQTNERMNARVVRKSMPESYGVREGGLGDESQAAAATCFRKESLLSIPRGNLSLHTRAGSTTTLFGKFISDLETHLVTSDGKHCAKPNTTHLHRVELEGTRWRHA